MTSTASTEILPTITGIVAAELGVPAQDLAPDRDLRLVEGADSVKVLRAVARIERLYDIELEDEDVFQLTTLNGAAAMITRTLAGRRG